MYMDVLSSKWLATQSILQSDRVNLAEHHIYGSSRLGMQKYLPDLLKYEYGPAITGSPYQSLIQAKPWYSLYGNDLFSSTVYNNSLSTSNMSTSGIGINTHVLGNRHYELTNHLGNVQATVLDRTTPVLGGVENTQLLGYHADISTAQDYYPFGMLMPGRYISDTDKHCVTINSTVLVSTPITASATGLGAAGVAYTYEGEPTPPPVWQLPIADDFEHEVLYLFHYIPAEEHPEGWVLHTNAEGGSVTYTVDLSSEPSGITSYFQLHPDTTQSEQQFGFGMELNEECQVEMRVRQYYNSDEGEYYEPIKWTTIRTGGDQNFVLPVDKNAVKAGGKTILELKYSSSNGDNFAQNIQVSVLTPWMHYYQVVPETRVVTICDEKDNYRFGFNGQEKDNEAKGLGNSINYLARLYDTRLGRFMSVDPLTSKFPTLTPYQFASNTPIQAIDLDGKEAFFIHGTASSPEAWSPKLTNLITKTLTRNVHSDATFSWRQQSKSYLNDENDRRIAALFLVQHVMDYRKANKIADEEITLIGHSHGGNVAIQAAQMLHDKYGIQVNVINFNTPAYNDPLSSENPAYNSGINSLRHFYTKQDGVAGGLAGDDKYTDGNLTPVFDGKNIELKNPKEKGWLKSHYQENINSSELKEHSGDKPSEVPSWERNPEGGYNVK